MEETVSRNDEGSGSDSRLSKMVDYTTLGIISLLIVFTPVVLLVITISFLMFTRDLQPAQLSLLELLELYLIELGIFVVFGYLLYRLTLASVRKHLPEVLDRLDVDDEPDRSPPRGAGSKPPESDENDSDGG